MGDSYADVLDQMDGLTSIDRYFAPDTIRSISQYENARNLFALSGMLKNPPILNLNDDSIDVIFKIDDRVVAFKGIGNPQKLSLAYWTGGNDPQLQTPYIGWDFNPRATWDSVTTAASETASDAHQAGSDLYDAGSQAYERDSTVVMSTAESLAGTASNVIDTAGEIGGEIVTVTGELLDEAAVVASDAADATEEVYVAVVELREDYLEVRGDYLGEFSDNAFENDDGSYSILKVGGYVLGGVLCVGSLVVAAGAGCIPLAVALAADATKAGLDTAALDKYDLIEQETADWGKLGVDVVALVGGGFLNYRAALQAGTWANMSRLAQAATLLGVNPQDLLDGGFQDWKSVESLLTGLDALRNIPGQFYNWQGNLSTFIRLGGDELAMQALLAGLMPGLPPDVIAGIVEALAAAAAGAVNGAIAGAEAGAQAGLTAGGAPGAVSGAVTGALSGGAAGAAAGMSTGVAQTASGTILPGGGAAVAPMTSGTPLTTQQTGTAGTALTTGPAQGTGAAQSTGASQSTGPAQSTGPSQSTGPARSTGPAQSAGPAQSTGPAQNSGGP